MRDPDRYDVIPTGKDGHKQILRFWSIRHTCQFPSVMALPVVNGSCSIRCLHRYPVPQARVGNMGLQLQSLEYLRSIASFH